MGTGTHAGSTGNTGSDRTGDRGNNPRVGQKAYGFTCYLNGQKCPASREFGAAKIRSEVEAAKHHRRFPHHVIAMYVKETTHVFGEATMPIPNLTEDIPPF